MSRDEESQDPRPLSSYPCVVTVDWGDGSTSPPIGPLPYADANKLATQIRKGLRANRRPVNMRVRVLFCVTPEQALAWPQVAT